MPQALAREGVLKTWTDQFIHGAAISQFGDPRAAGRQAIELADTPMPIYHYMSYMLPAAFAWPLDLPGLPLATSLWAPVGFFTLCASVYTLGAALAGTPGGFAALAALTLLPDPGTYGLHNRAFGYYWYVLAVPGASYGVGVVLLSLAFLHRWAQARGARALRRRRRPAGRFRIHPRPPLPARPAGVAGERRSACALERAAQARADGGGGRGLRAVRGRLLPARIRRPCMRSPSSSRSRTISTIRSPTSRRRRWWAALLLIFPAALGAFVILYPLSVLLLHRARGLRAIDLVPLAFLFWYLLLMLSAPVPSHGDATELTQRPFVLVYAVIAIWTAAGFARWVALQGGLRVRRVWVSLLVLAALALGGALLYTVPDARWLEAPRRSPRGVPQAARFLRSHSRPGDVLAVEGLTLERVYTDAAVQLVSLSGVPAYLSRPFIHARSRPCCERHAALAGVAAAPDAAAALERLRQARHPVVRGGEPGPGLGCGAPADGGRPHRSALGRAAAARGVRPGQRRGLLERSTWKTLGRRPRIWDARLAGAAAPGRGHSRPAREPGARATRRAGARLRLRRPAVRSLVPRGGRALRGRRPRRRARSIRSAQDGSLRAPRAPRTSW